jgi:hypothetical protein
MIPLTTRLFSHWSTPLKVDLKTKAYSSQTSTVNIENSAYSDIFWLINLLR